MRQAALLLPLGALLALVPPAFAQRSSRAYVGGAFLYGEPQGEFGDYVDRGFGGVAHLIVRLDHAGLFGLRLDGGVLEYGRETTSVPLSSTLGGRITVDLETTNDVLFVGAGPQLMVPNGTLRPYVNGTVGLGYFSTQSYIRGRDDPGERFGDTQHLDDVSLMYGAGAGVYIPLRRGSRPISLDVGARYQRGGRTEYLVEGGIEDNPNGTLSLSPIESETDLATFHVGVTVGLGGGRDRDHDDDRRRRRRRW